MPRAKGRGKDGPVDITEFDEDKEWNYQKRWIKEIDWEAVFPHLPINFKLAANRANVKIDLRCFPSIIEKAATIRQISKVPKFKNDTEVFRWAIHLGIQIIEELILITNKKETKSLIESNLELQYQNEKIQEMEEMKILLEVKESANRHFLYAYHNVMDIKTAEKRVKKEIKKYVPEHLKEWAAKIAKEEFSGKALERFQSKERMQKLRSKSDNTNESDFNDLD